MTLLTTAQVAERLQVTPRTLKNWRHHGGGPVFVKLGDQPRSPVRYRAEDVDRFVARRYTRTHEQAVS